MSDKISPESKFYGYSKNAIEEELGEELFYEFLETTTIEDVDDAAEAASEHVDNYVQVLFDALEEGIEDDIAENMAYSQASYVADIHRYLECYGKRFKEAYSRHMMVMGRKPSECKRLAHEAASAETDRMMPNVLG